MKKAALFFFLILFVVINIRAQERGPVAVSPGNDAGVVKVATGCPTFSWTDVDWAVAYKVVVFETGGPNLLVYEEMEAIASPVLTKEIQGRSLSWTPSTDERLGVGGKYVWYVKAVDAYGQGMWSAGSVFRVDIPLSFDGVEENVRERLENQGLSEEVIDEVLEDMRSGVRDLMVSGVDTSAIGDSTSSDLGIQGNEEGSNTYYGEFAGFKLSSGSGLHNTFIGYYAGFLNADGLYNTFMGSNAGISNSGNWNTFMGYGAGYLNTDGLGNTFIGYQTGHENFTGHWNVFVGRFAGYNSETGDYNTFVGDSAGIKNTTGGGNTFIGRSAGHENTEGSYNTIVGRLAGYDNQTGNYNIFLGYSAGHFETGSNKLYIDNSTTSSPLIWGDFDSDILTVYGQFAIGTKSPAYKMEMETTAYGQ